MTSIAKLVHHTLSAIVLQDEVRESDCVRITRTSELCYELTSNDGHVKTVLCCSEEGLISLAKAIQEHLHRLEQEYGKKKD